MLSSRVTRSTVCPNMASPTLASGNTEKVNSVKKSKRRRRRRTKRKKKPDLVSAEVSSNTLPNTHCSGVAFTTARFTRTTSSLARTFFEHDNREELLESSSLEIEMIQNALNYKAVASKFKPIKDGKIDYQKKHMREKLISKKIIKLKNNLEKKRLKTCRSNQLCSSSKHHQLQQLQQKQKQQQKHMTKIESSNEHNELMYNSCCQPHHHHHQQSICPSTSSSSCSTKFLPIVPHNSNNIINNNNNIENITNKNSLESCLKEIFEQLKKQTLEVFLEKSQTLKVNTSTNTDAKNTNTNTNKENYLTTSEITTTTSNSSTILDNNSGEKLKEPNGSTHMACHYQPSLCDQLQHQLLRQFYCHQKYQSDSKSFSSPDMLCLQKSINALMR